MRYLMLAVATIIATGLVACGKKNDSVATANGCVGESCGPVVNGHGYGYGHGISNRVGGYLENIGEDAFAQMLGQYGGFCLNNGWNNHPGQLSASLSYGSYNCKAYAKRGYVNLRFDPTGTQVQIKVGAGGAMGGSGFSTPNREVVFNGRIIPRNNSAGMEIRGSGAQATGSWSAQYDNGIVILIEQGAPSSTMMVGHVTYRGRAMGTVNFYRY